MTYSKSPIQCPVKEVLFIHGQCIKNEKLEPFRPIREDVQDDFSIQKGSSVEMIKTESDRLTFLIEFLCEWESKTTNMVICIPSVGLD
jgi:hypothetical protein